MPAVVSGPMVRNHGAERMWGRGLLSCGGLGAGRQGQDTLFKSKTVSEDHHAGVQERPPFTCPCSGAKEERMNFAAVLWKGGSSLLFGHLLSVLNSISPIVQQRILFLTNLKSWIEPAGGQERSQWTKNQSSGDNGARSWVSSLSPFWIPQNSPYSSPP